MIQLNRLLIILVSCFLFGCASQPKISFPQGLKAKSITIPADQKTVSDQIGKPWALIPAGEYVLRWENKDQRFFANADETIVLNGEKVKGGISIALKSAKFMIYKDFANPQSMSAIGRLIGPAQEKGTNRGAVFWIIDDQPLTWKISEG